MHVRSGSGDTWQAVAAGRRLTSDPRRGVPPGHERTGPGGTVEQCLDRLASRLHGPERAKKDLLGEVRDGLHDAVEAYRREGLSDREAQRRAVGEFGAVEDLLPAYQDELAAGAVLGLVLRTSLAFVGVTACSMLMWWGAPWTGMDPPAAYLLLADWVDRLGYGLVVGGPVTYSWLAWSARRGRRVSRAAAQVVGHGTALMLALTGVGGAAVFAWSVRLWPAAPTWPPMLIGILVLAAMYGWLVRCTWQCVRSGRG